MAPSKQRVRAPAATFPVPQNRDETNAAIDRIGALQRQRVKMHADKDARLAAINEAVKLQIEPIDTEIRSLSSGIQAWCESHRTELTREGKVKFHDFASGTVKWRMRPPKVTLRAVDMVIDLLRAAGLLQFIRTKEEVNKEAVLADPAAVAGIRGITVEQGEDFVVEPFETKLEEVAQ